MIPYGPFNRTNSPKENSVMDTRSFKVVCVTPRYCEVTDALIGSTQTTVAYCATLEIAVKALSEYPEMEDWDDPQYFILNLDGRSLNPFRVESHYKAPTSCVCWPEHTKGCRFTSDNCYPF